MPPLPQFSATSRMNTGGSAQTMAPLTLGRPNLISPALMQHREIAAPFYNTPIDKVGPLIRNKAINQFGEILLDITINLADKRAKLEAEDETQEFYKGLRALELNFFQLEGKEAVDGYDTFSAKVNELEENSLSNVSNHAKIYLTKSLRNLKNSALSTATNFTATQYKVAEQNAINNQLMRTSDRLKDLVYETDPEKVQKVISTSLDSIGFRTDVERQQAQDALYGQMIKYQSDSILADKDNVSNTMLYKRLDSFQNKIKNYKPHISLKQFVAFNNAYIDSSIRVANEIVNREIQQNKADKDLEKSIINDVYKTLSERKPFPEATIRTAITFGILDWKDYDTFKELFERRYKEEDEASERTPEQTAKYLDYVGRITKKESFSSIMRDLTFDAETESLSSNDIISISKDASSTYSGLYDDTFRHGKALGDWLIKTRGPMAEIRGAEETAMYSEYFDVFKKRLTDLYESGNLNSDTAEKLIKRMQDEYGAEVQWSRIAWLPTLDRSIAHPKNATELARAWDDIQGQTNLTEEEIDAALVLVQRYEHIFKIRQKFVIK